MFATGDTKYIGYQESKKFKCCNFATVIPEILPFFEMFTIYKVGGTNSPACYRMQRCTVLSML